MAARIVVTPDRGLLDVWMNPHETRLIPRGHLCGERYQEVGFENLFRLTPGQLEAVQMELSTHGIYYNTETN